jgi:ligand-binding SRPBCC domain-containing protein
VTVHRLQREQYLDHPLQEVFAFFAQAHNLERITPPWLSFQVLSTSPIEMRVGTLIDYRLRVHGLPLRWTSRIEDWEPGRTFVDRQLRGPYALWRHRHTFAESGQGTVVRDEVDYALPLGGLGNLVHPLFVRRDLERIFAYRHQAVPELLARATTPATLAAGQPGR